MDAVLGSGCVNEKCNALKSQTAKEAFACTKKTHLPEEVVGRGGECKYTYMTVVNSVVLDLTATDRAFGTSR
jgi:hypothetical protein